MANDKLPRKKAASTIRHTPRKRDQAAFGASAPVVRTVLAVLTDQDGGIPLDHALRRAFKAAHGLSPAERRSVVHEASEILRRRARLGWHLERERARVTPHNLYLAWSAFESRRDPKGVRMSPLDAALGKALARRRFDDPRMPEAVQLECPPAFENALRKSLGGHFPDEMRASLDVAPVDLRVNLLKGTLELGRQRLKAEGIDGEATPISPWGLRCLPGANVAATAAFHEGFVEFQDEGSQLAALMVDARAGMQVMDFCAGTGGKTLALGAAMGNRGHLVACDISRVRLVQAKLRLKRAGVENAERVELKPEDDKRLKKLYGRFDRVLVDAPCSGTGSWRRNPDARWSAQAPNLDHLIQLQDAILIRAARFVKPGGRLVYATCSLLRPENDARITAFLNANRAFELRDARLIWREVSDGRPWPCGDDRVLRLSPAAHGTDGFFAAILQRTSP